jgi:UPF0755 protein
MKRILLRVFLLLVSIGLGAAGYLYYRWHDEQVFVQTPFGQGTVTLEVPSGTSNTRLAILLKGAGVVSDAHKFHTHVRFFRRDAKPKAGEYEFALPLTPEEVLSKLERGEVKLYRFTVPEGLRADEIAAIIGATSLCKESDFLALARSAAAAKKLGVPANSLEGFLFPDTYSVAKQIGCQGIAQAMVNRYREAVKEAEADRLPSVKLGELEIVTLASIIEKETGQPSERPRISCVFHNRLKKRMRLGTDPTVIYAKLLAQDFQWDGKLHKSDLQRDHPYNTYVIFGLPPGPIASPGLAALKAAVHPIECGDYFFVSKNDTTHVFCPDLACHEAAVQKWQVEYFRGKKG